MVIRGSSDLFCFAILGSLSGLSGGAFEALGGPSWASPGAILGLPGAFLGLLNCFRFAHPAEALRA